MTAFKKTPMICLCFLLLLTVLISCSAEDSHSTQGTDDSATEPAENDAAADSAHVPAEDDGLYDIIYTQNPPRRSGEKKYTLAPGEVQDIEVKASDRRGYTFLGWSDGVTSMERSGDTVAEDTVLTALYDYDFVENTPALIIYTDEMNHVTSKEEYIGATVSVMNCHYRYERTELACEIRGRGNSTWGMSKRPYVLRFAEKINLLGTGEGPARKWNLMPYAHDQSIFRTYGAFYMADLMGSMDYVPNMQLVEVYLNGVYVGTYFIVEPVQVHEYRLDLEEPIDRLTKEFSFLVEFDGRAPEEGQLNQDYVQVNGQNYAIRSDVFTQRQVYFIKEKIEELNDAVDKGDRDEIAEILDIDSARDMYILLEYFMNVDANFASVFLYYDLETGKFYYGPPWDFDLSSGSDERLNEYDLDELYVGKEPGHRSGSSLIRKLTGNNEWFVPEVAERWLTVREYAMEMMDEITRMSELHGEAIERNFAQWRITKQRLRRGSKAVSPENHAEHMEYLFYWLNGRIEGLDGYYAGIREKYGIAD